MAISEQARQALLQKLDEVLGPKDASALMEEVSGRDWGALATKVDLDHLAALTRRDIEAMEGRMDERFKGFEGRMDERFKGFEGRMDERFNGFEGRMEERFKGLEGRMDERFKGFEGRFEATLGRELGNMYKELAAHTRTTVFACIMAVMTSTGIALGSTRL